MKMSSHCLLLSLCTLTLLFSPTALAQRGNTQTSNDPFGRLQFIHTIINTGPLDVYLDGILLLDDFAFRTATAFLPIPNGAHKIDVFAAKGTASTAPLWTGQLSILSQERYVLTVFGQAGDVKPILRQNVREESLTSDIEFFFIHTAPDTGPIDIRLRDPDKDNALVSLIHHDLNYGTTSIYTHLLPRQYNFEVTTGQRVEDVIDVFHFNLSSYQNRPFVFVTSGAGLSASEGFALIGYDHTGTPILPAITTTSIVDAAALPSTFVLEQNYPNPFNPTTHIQYALSQRAAVRLVVLDLLGRTVQTLVLAEQPAGTYTVPWNGRNDAGAPVPSGIYLYHLEAGAFAATRPMLLVK